MGENELIDFWPVIKSYFKKHSIVKHQLDSYNAFIDHDIQNCINSLMPLTIQKKQQYQSDFKDKNDHIIHTFTMKDAFITNPVIRDHETGGTIKVDPHTCMIRKASYRVPLYVNIEHQTENIKTKNVSKFTENCFLAYIPLMVNSKYCVWHKKKKNACEYDPGGYFIINGSEKCVVAQEALLTNQIFCFKGKAPEEWIGEIRSKYESRKPSTFKTRISFHKQQNLYLLDCYLPSIKKEIPLYVLFKALGLNEEEMISCIIPDGNPKLLQKILPSTMLFATENYTQNDCIDYIVKRGVWDLRTIREKRVQFGIEYLILEVLPHIQVDNTIEFSRNILFQKKALFIGKMCRQILERHTGMNTKINDRDSLTLKSINTSGGLLTHIFYIHLLNCWKEFAKRVQKTLDNEKPLIIHKELSNKSITVKLRTALATGNWSSTQVGVSQTLATGSFIGIISHLRRISSPLRENKSAKPRQLHASQYGFICGSETPEGQSIGLVKNLALLCTISNFSSIEPIKELIDFLESNGDCELIQSVKVNTDKNTIIYVNGDPYAYTNNPTEFHQLFLRLRRELHIAYDISICRSKDEHSITIRADAGRPIRPLFILKNNRLQMTSKHIQQIHDGTIDFDELLKTGIIEYIDAFEQEQSLIAMNLLTILENANKPKHKQLQYTHMELHPATMKGVGPSLIPFIANNPGPRVLFQSSMAKQAIGTYSTAYQKRVDTTSYLLNYNQMPLASTEEMELLHLNDNPAGINAVVAIMSYTGYNQEDSLLINQAFLDRGGMRATILTTQSEICQNTEIEIVTGQMVPAKEIVAFPDIKKIVNPKNRFNYSKLEIDGLPKIGTILTKNDIIIAKLVPLPNNAKLLHSLSFIEHNKLDNEFSGFYKDESSVFYKGNENGYVDSIIRTTNTEGMEVIRVKIRAIRIPEIGDKFCSRHGQKGTVGMIIPQEDMPYTHIDGIQPDIIVNPHAIPSRMTIGHLLECLLSKTICLTDKRKDNSNMYLNDRYLGNATSFNNNSTNVHQIAHELHKCGYQKHGNETMYSGLTGFMLKAKIFIGPTYYQRLKHMVQGKIHARSTGPYQMLTRQPMDGRAKYGGLRLGEMERDVLISYGAANFLKDRTLYCSDYYELILCDNCHRVSHHIKGQDMNSYQCTNRQCGGYQNFSKIQVPYAFKLAMQELQAMHINPKLMITV